ncbi:nucleotidyltransferase family protein [Croceibacterium ferulae]|uniref:nucleotidyltransferase family protein n=1 Tax=Croceibacterium ferulae TaxID=1854641 RepID=UPI000EB214DD|nr:NTP transferase domain-containing protein [Croceibacterium ferulae]
MAERVLAAMLAAGQARRFGGGKLDAPCAGRRLGSWAVRAVEQAGVGRAIIVVPPEAPIFARESGWPLVTNRAAERGLGTSLACAAQAAAADGATQLLVLLADMPLIDASLLCRLLASPAPAAIEHAPGRPGVPALLPASTFAQLDKFAGDRGAAGLLRAVPDLSLVTAPPAALLDVDDPAGLRQAAMLLQIRP